jgi:hypothetical protein
VVFPNENSLLVQLYLGIQNASKKVDDAYPQLEFNLVSLAIFFEGRLDGALDL